MLTSLASTFVGIGEVKGSDEFNSISVPAKDGTFKSVPLYVLPDQQVVDLSSMDFSGPEDRAYSLSVLEQAPRLVVLNLQRASETSEASRDSLHSRWVTGLALKRHNQNMGFLITKEG